MENGPRRWVPDEEVTRCFLCSRGFDVTTRKHHCRCCGRVACASCTPSKALVPLNEVVYPPSDASLSLTDFDPREVQRVCRECDHVLAPMQADLQQTMTHSAMPTHHNRSSVDRYLNSPVVFDMTGEIVKAANTLLNFTGDNAIEGADSIPKDLIAEAKGLAFITFVKVGLFVTARVGTGLVVGRRQDGGWSAPSALGSVGLGWGFQVGGELTDVVIVLNTIGAVEAFTGTGQAGCDMTKSVAEYIGSTVGMQWMAMTVQYMPPEDEAFVSVCKVSISSDGVSVSIISLGTELSLSVGPVGRTASTDIRAGDGGVTAAFSYAHSKGVFIGVSVEAATVVTRKDTNRDFYGTDVTAAELLLGEFPPPKAAEPLYKALEEVETNHGLMRGRNRAYNPRFSSHPPEGSWAARGDNDGGHDGGCAGGSVGGNHFAPFRPDAEDHLRSFTVSPDEKRQMEEDYRLALAMQKGEAVGARGSGGGGGGGGGGNPVSAAAASAAAATLSKSSSMIRNGSNGHGNASGSGSWLGGVGRGGQKDQVDEWELERRARMEQARKADAGESAASANELGELASFVNSGGGAGGGGGRGEGAGRSSFEEFGGGVKSGGGFSGSPQEEEEQSDSSDDDEYRRDIAQYTARRKGL